MFAVIETGGKQLKVEAGETYTFDKVLFVGGDETKIGAPYVEGATVSAKVEKHGKEKKVIIYKYNPKKHYHKKQGHRQPYTKLVIEAINA